MTLRRLRVLLRGLPAESQFKSEVREMAEQHAAEAKEHRLEDAQERYRKDPTKGAQP